MANCANGLKKTTVTFVNFIITVYGFLPTVENHLVVLYHLENSLCDIESLIEITAWPCVTC
jgi:hypothetical protein